MASKSLMGCLLVIGALTAPGLNAATLITTPDGKATAINDLTIGSRTFDIDFRWFTQTHQEIASNLVITSSGEAADLLSAVGALFSANDVVFMELSSTSDSFLQTAGSTTLFYGVAADGISPGVDELLGRTLTNPPEWEIIDFTSGIPVNSSYPFSYLELTETTVVPVPAAAWLFGSAMIGAGVFGRRRMRA